MRDLNKIDKEITQMFKDTFDRKLSLKEFKEKIERWMSESYDEGYYDDEDEDEEW